MQLSLYQCTFVNGGKRCAGRLQLADGGLICETCGKQYKIFENIPIFRDEPIEQLRRESDYAKRDRARELNEGCYVKERKFLKSQIDSLGITGPVLDIGCGNGLLAPAVVNYVGLEYSLPGLLDPGWNGEHRVCGDAQSLPFAPETFDGIVSINTFEHIPHIDRVYSELERVLCPGGVLMLHPAWHSSRANTELIPILPYSKLNLRQKWVKLMLPVLSRKPYKFLRRVPARAVRRLLTRGPRPMKWTPLTPYPHPNNVYSLDKWLPDTDAAADIDSHETIMYFVRRGYQCLSHQTIWRQILAGHDDVVLRKPR
jgi:SAM-dependent methyltransferase